ncbi:MAG: hypothetical protein A3H97_11570 [Acidobacteria bacterium RIFCSPLOWO2_02_FULL_65_29]|nr:MAG: hypothetical protein A3H97_11570 [Acidobacteria bacterium RIFCSPLOWO2_02_FULL_65_29]
MALVGTGAGRAGTFALLIGAWSAVVFSAVATSTEQPRVVSAPVRATDAGAVVNKYCVTCHNKTLRTGGLALDTVDAANPGANPETWEKVVAKLRQASMPPPGRPRPDAATYDDLASSLEQQLDHAWEASPNPGRVGPVHRLNRTEYSNAVRDLFALDIDVTSLLPADETADGSFDNFGEVLSISTAHLDRYMSVARQVTRLATGLPPANPTVQTFEIPLHVVQDDLRSDDLPFGSRGGIAVPYHFPADGEYLFKVRLRTNWQDYILGMGWPQQFDIRLDGERLRRFTVGGNAPGRPSPQSFTGPGEPGSIDWEEYMMSADHQLEVRVPVVAGPHVVGVSFLRDLWEPEGVPQPVQRGRLLANDDLYMDYQAIQTLQIGGPYQIFGTAKDTPSRRAIFICQPKSGADEMACATKILSSVAQRAYRRPVTERDLSLLRDFFQRGRKDGGNFDAGIQFALEFLLSDPAFLLRVHPEPARAAARRAYRLTNVELASRLSFFLWSSIPDQTLLDVAARGRLSNPAILDQQVKRMLAEPRAVDALATNFAAQWLNLRRVGEVVVDPEIYPNFDANLLESFQQETELFVASNIREDRPLSELLSADYTFVNERLARHYGIPGVYGSRFRRVALPDHDQRGGLLGHGGLLAATSYPDRTSPVLRGKWLLDNIFGLPIPPPPPGVDTNLDNRPGQAKSIRERLAQHRSNVACANCHSVIDPLGFALENFDVLGGWRTIDEAGHEIDAEGTAASGAEVNGFPGLRRLLLARPEQFPRTVTEKLLAYAIGRRLDYYDQPVVRKIVRQAAASDYRWSAIVFGIAKSVPFLMQAPRPAPDGAVVRR